MEICPGKCHSAGGPKLCTLLGFLIIWHPIYVWKPYHSIDKVNIALLRIYTNRNFTTADKRDRLS